MSEQKNQDEQKKLVDQVKNDPAADFVQTPSGPAYDVGEPIVQKMNRERAILDKDLFFQDLYENWLVCVDRNEIRRKPNSGIILRWDIHTTFDDFLSDAVDNIDRQIESIKFAKSVNAQKISSTDGDFFMSEAKIDAGSAAVGKKFGVEDYDALYEILRKSKELLLKYKTGKLQLIINQKTGRIRMVRSQGD